MPLTKTLTMRFRVPVFDDPGTAIFHSPSFLIKIYISTQRFQLVTWTVFLHLMNLFEPVGCLSLGLMLMSNGSNAKNRTEIRVKCGKVTRSF